MHTSDLDQLETKIIKLLRSYYDLKRKNADLKKQLTISQSEKSVLYTKQEQAQHQVEQMISRLKNLGIEL